MAAGNPPLRLLDLPIEILENIVLRLCAQGILKLRILNRAFRDLIDVSPAVQYRVDLFSAALEDDPRNASLVLADRRAHLEDYRSRWDRFGQAKQSSVELPPHTQRVIDGEVLACIQEAADGKIDVTFIRLPSVSRGIPRKRWTVRGLPKNGAELKMYPRLDLLVLPEILGGGRAFQIHLLRLSDGRSHPLAPVDPTVFHVDYGQGKAITKLVALITEHRLVVVAAVRRALRWQDHGGVLIWDWRNGHKMLKSYGLCVTEAQVIDDYRVLWITKPSELSKDGVLVLWDTSGPQPRQSMFEMPSNKLDVVYIPERLMTSASIQSGIGLHRADPNQRIVGVVCQGSYGDVRLDDYYMITISTADLCAYASAQNAGESKIRWEKWQSSATIVRIDLKITTVTCISGSRFFAVVKGVSYTAYATLLRIYDFSPGARGRRHTERPAVKNLIVNAGRMVKQVGTASWDFSEDNLLMFNTHIATRKVTLHLWTM
ncbi:hypothetical protein BDM02DRAFT_2056462 [Thelephora ganbajun]|uniref:Uncharacterized protein n=1 Tax=Thelephora ganbajun TaxID=370292 RepID=A0ACB6ZGR8_THEGA|nr:hypothetical protein BDM02DRAFT_2056462 [Thelephora ganbajun]